MVCSFTYIKHTLLHKRGESTAVGIFTNKLYNALYCGNFTILSASQNYKMVQTSLHSRGNTLEIEREVTFAPSFMKSVNWKGFDKKRPLPCTDRLRKAK